MNKLVIGLGNPGEQYDKTRHNVGFMAVDDLASNLISNTKLSFKYHKKSNSEIAETNHLILAKPQTFMNNSGRAIRQLISCFNVADGDVLVVYDDIDLPVGEVRYRDEGSSAGHKGMQSIIDILNTNTIKRIRIGVGRPTYHSVSHSENSNEQDASEYVLGKFSTTEIKKIKDGFLEVHRIVLEKFISENGD